MLDARERILNEPADRTDFLHTVMCQVGMPRRMTTERIFERHNGHMSILLEAGKLYNGKDWIEHPLPYGTTPRLVMVHLSSEAIRMQSRRVEIGDSMRQFLLTLGMGDGGGPCGGYTTRATPDRITRRMSTLDRHAFRRQSCDRRCQADQKI